MPFPPISLSHPSVFSSFLFVFLLISFLFLIIFSFSFHLLFFNRVISSLPPFTSFAFLCLSFHVPYLFSFFPYFPRPIPSPSIHFPHFPFFPSRFPIPFLFPLPFLFLSFLLPFPSPFHPLQRPPLSPSMFLPFSFLFFPFLLFTFSFPLRFLFPGINLLVFANFPVCQSYSQPVCQWLFVLPSALCFSFSFCRFHSVSPYVCSRLTGLNLYC